MPLIELSEEAFQALEAVIKGARPKKPTGRPKGSKDSELTRLRKSAAQRNRYKDKGERKKTSDALREALKKKKEGTLGDAGE